MINKYVVESSLSHRDWPLFSVFISRTQASFSLGDIFFYARLNFIKTLCKLLISRKVVISLDIFGADLAPKQNMVAIALILPNLFDKNIKCITAL